MAAGKNTFVDTGPKDKAEAEFNSFCRYLVKSS